MSIAGRHRQALRWPRQLAARAVGALAMLQGLRHAVPPMSLSLERLPGSGCRWKKPATLAQTARNTARRTLTASWARCPRRWWFLYSLPFAGLWLALL